VPFGWTRGRGLNPHGQCPCPHPKRQKGAHLDELYCGTCITTDKNQGKFQSEQQSNI